MSVCVSNIHRAPVPATVHGAFASPYNEAHDNRDVWYCDTCATVGQAIGMFTPDPEQPA